VRVIFIPKPGHTSPQLVKPFRPISLTSILLKTMEKLVDQSIRMVFEIFEKMNNALPSLMAPGDQIVPIIAFGRRFLVELLPRSSWLSHETSEILPSDGNYKSN
jgi:hypothetical protein